MCFPENINTICTMQNSSIFVYNVVTNEILNYGMCKHVLGF